MSLFTKIRDTFRKPAPDPSEANRLYWERARTQEAEETRQFDELVDTMPLTEARALFDRDQRFQLERIACEHDDYWDCKPCQAAEAREYGPIPPEYEASRIRRSVAEQIMRRDDPDTVAAAEQALQAGRDRAAAMWDRRVDQYRRGMTYEDARELLRKQKDYDYIGADVFDSRQLEAARRIVDADPHAAISRTQPLPVVPARLDAAGTDAALLLLRAEEAAAERALSAARAAADPESDRVEDAEDGLTVARRDLQAAEHHARAGGDVNAWWLEELSRKEQDAADDLDSLHDHFDLPIVGSPEYHAEGWAEAFEQAEADLAGAQWNREAAEKALAPPAARPAERSAGQVFEEVLAEEDEAQRQLDEALDGVAPGAVLDQAEARWQTAVQDREAAEQDNDGQDSTGTSADPVEPTVRGRLLEHARWAYEHAEQIDREASQARERGDFSAASEWSCRSLGLRDSAREFERGARELGSDAVPPATVQALAESLDQARQHHERAMRIEREQVQAGQRGQYWDFFDARGCQALGLRDSAREFERDARASTGPRTDQATTGGFGFVAPSQRAAGAAGAAVESAQDAVNNLSAQPDATSERAEYGRAQTDRWAADQHEHGAQHSTDYGAKYCGGLADGRGAGW